MNILFTGDIVGKPGRKMIKKYLPKLQKEYEIDYVIAQLQRIVPRIREISMTYAKQEAFSAFVEDH